MAKLWLLLSMSLVSMSLKGQMDILTNIQKSKHLMYINMDSALYYADLGISKAKAIDMPNLVFAAQRAKGLIYEENKKLLLAQKSYKIALDLANTRLQDTDQYKIYTDWAIIHKKLGQYAVAKEYHQLTIEKAQQKGNWEMVEQGYHGLGTMYSMLSDFNQSVQAYYKSIEAAEKWGNKKGIVLSEQNISNIYMKAKNYDMALKNIEKTYQLALQLGDSLRIAAVLKIYGNINLAMGFPHDAFEKHQKAKSIFATRLDKPRLAESYLALGEIQIVLKNYPKAQQYFDSCAMLSSFLPLYSLASFWQKKAIYTNCKAVTKRLSKHSLFV